MLLIALIDIASAGFAALSSRVLAVLLELDATEGGLLMVALLVSVEAGISTCTPTSDEGFFCGGSRSTGALTSST
jgi:hypothetical protein